MSESHASGAGGSVTRVRFAVPDAPCPLEPFPDGCDLTLHLEELIPRSDGGYAEFFRVSGADLAAACDAARRDDHVTVLERRDGVAIFESEAADDCPALALAEAGAIPRTIECTGGRAQFRAAVPPTADASAVVDRFLQRIPDARLVSKYEDTSPTPLLAGSDPAVDAADRLTDRQREVLLAAHEAGYYNWPRCVTGEELADRLDISSATLHKHLRAVERKLVTAFVEERTRVN